MGEYNDDSGEANDDSDPDLQETVNKLMELVDALRGTLMKVHRQNMALANLCMLRGVFSDAEYQHELLKLTALTDQIEGRILDKRDGNSE